MLGGSEEKECPYSEFNALDLLDKLLEKGLIELPEIRCPEDIGELMILNTVSIRRSSVIP